MSDAPAPPAGQAQPSGAAPQLPLRAFGLAVGIGLIAAAGGSLLLEIVHLGEGFFYETLPQALGIDGVPVWWVLIMLLVGATVIVIAQRLPGASGFPHSIRIEEFTHNGNFMIRAELPGIDPEKDVHINVKDGMLTIEGKREEHEESDQRSEFFYGRFMRTLSLPSGTSSADIKASYRDGILEIAIPMKETSERSESIPISHG